MTDGQKKALVDHWARFGLDLDAGPIDPHEIFGNDHRLVIEIGFGMGDSLAETVANDPATNFIGIEVHRPGVGHLLGIAATAEFDNLKVFNADSVAVLANCIPDSSTDVVQIFFPDPWHKKRHHKRRLVTSTFAALVRDKLKPGGIFHIATDWPDYAGSIQEALESAGGLTQVSPPKRPVTKYERRGQRLGHDISDLAWIRSGA